MPDDQSHDSAKADGNPFRLLVSHLTDCAMFVVDRHGLVQAWNVGAEHLFGYAESEIMGWSLDRFFTPEDREAGVPQQEMHQALHTGIGPDDRWHLRKDGSRFWASGLLTPVRGAAGEVCGFAKILRDRTAWKLQQDAAEEARRRQEARVTAILDTALDCIITMDARGHVIEFNPAAERTFGYRRGDVLGRELSELIIPESLRAAHRRGLAHYLATGEGPVLGKRIELAAMRADGSEFQVELAITRIPTDGPPVFTAYLREISDRVWVARLRSARFAITQHLAQTLDLETAAVGTLRTICENLQWDVGAFWVVGPEGEALTCLATWHEAGTPGRRFIEESCGRTFVRGEGLPGQVWATGESAWLLDVRRVTNFPRGASAAAVGLQSAFAFPILVGGTTHCVIEFFTRQLREPDSGLLETMATVAGQVGQFLKRLQAEQTLRESEGRFRALMEQAPFSVQILSPDGHTSRVNQAWSDLWGVSLEQLAGYDILHDPQLEVMGVTPYLRRAFAGEAVVIPEIRYDPNDSIPGLTRHSNPVRWVSAVAYPLKDSGGRVREVVLVHDDITARKAAESAVRESEEKFRLLVDTIPNLAWMADAEGGITWYNDRWYDYTGSTPDEMQGWGWQRVHDPDTLPEVLRQWRESLRSGEAFEMPFVPLRGKDGVFRPFFTRVVPLRDASGAVVQWFGTNTDVSSLKRAEEDLREADRRKDEYLAMLAHELRNPLAPIRTAAALLKRIRTDEPQVARASEIIARQVSHMSGLLDDLLDVSRITRGLMKIEMERVDVGSVVSGALEQVRALVDEKRHDIEVDQEEPHLEVMGSALRLNQVVANLLDNAAKYSAPESRIEVAVRTSGGRVRIEVTDNGQGISAELLARVFEPFTQGERGSHRSEGGLGLGLAVVRGLVELHGGRVSAHSPWARGGSRFVVDLPQAPRAATAGADLVAIPATPATPESLDVLVVDDNRDAADSLAELLQVIGHRVQSAYTAREALNVMHGKRFDAAILDIGLPDMSGYALAEAIRARGLPVRTLIALSGYGQRDDRDSSAAAGFEHHLVKPVEPDVLVRVLSTSAQKSATALDDGRLPQR